MAAGKEKSTKLDALLENMPDLQQRFFWGILLAVIAVFIIYFSPALFTTMVVMLVIMMAFEWCDITASAPKDEKIKWQAGGLAYIGIPTLATLWLRSGENGADVIMWMFAVIWMTDTAAYFVGKSLGGPKLAPKVSPKKTWSGLIGGVLGSMLVGLISSLMFEGSASFFMWFSGFLAVLAQMGDLVESKVKRNFGVKDSGNLIPGHGGVLDRLDGLTLVAPMIMIMAMLVGEKFL